MEDVRPVRSVNLYVRGIPIRWSRADVRDFFNRHGTPININRPIRHAAVVRYSSPEEAEEAYRDLQGYQLGRGHQLRVSLTPPPEGYPILGRPQEFTRDISFDEASRLLQAGEIVHYIVDPQNQEDVPQGLTRVTLVDINGRERDVVARYDPQTDQIFPPA